MKRVVNIIFTVFWMTVLFSSIGFKVSSKITGRPDFNKYIIQENRNHALKPDFRNTPVKKWGANIEAWYNDNFAWRSRIIQFYRYAHFKWLKSSVTRQVPGSGGWVFRRGGDWAELEDYLGAFELTPEETARWMELFEGRVQWAESHGTKYLQVITPVKAQEHPEKIFPVIRNHRGRSVGLQIRNALKDSYANDNVLFINDLLSEEVKTGRRVFYEEDHHINAYGCYLLYGEIVKKLSEWFPGITPVPFYENPPEAVVNGIEPGCYEKDRRLAVVYPGSKLTESRLLEISQTGYKFPMRSVSVSQPGEDRSIVMANDSFMRFPLLTWKTRDEKAFALPIGGGFNRITSYIFLRFATGQLDGVIADEIPSVIIEQFPESRLTLNVIGYDETMRRAAAFRRGKPVEKSAGGKHLAVGIFENVVADSAGGKITAELKDSAGKVLSSSEIMPGVRRAVFFGETESPDGKYILNLVGGKSESASLEIRTP